MQQPSKIVDRRPRADGAMPRGVLPASCPVHAGFPVACPLCAAAAAPRDKGVERSVRLTAQANEGRAALARLDSRRERKVAKQRERRAEVREAEGRDSSEPIRLDVDGVLLTIADAADRYGVRDKTVRERLRHGRTVRQALGLDPLPTSLRAGVETITHDGVTDSISGWAKRRGLSVNTVKRRLRAYGYTPAEALGFAEREDRRGRTPKVFVTWRGETRTLRQWARETGVNYHTLKDRVRMGRTGDELFLSPDYGRRVIKHRPKQVA